jgi:hypothetical protein
VGEQGITHLAVKHGAIPTGAAFQAKRRISRKSCLGRSLPGLNYAAVRDDGADQKSKLSRDLNVP